MKQLTVQDHVKHMEFLEHLQGSRSRKCFKYQTSKLRGKGCFYSLETATLKPEAGLQTRKTAAGGKVYSQKSDQIRV